MIDTNRNLDLAIARLLGLDVLGQAPCSQDPETGTWGVSWNADHPDDTSQPVYLHHCCCDDPLFNEVKVLGHVASCLKVVPFYHKSDTLARKALEQICDERQLNSDTVYMSISRLWFVHLSRNDKDNPIDSGIDGSFPLAICKALVGLEEKTK